MFDELALPAPLEERKNASAIPAPEIADEEDAVDAEEVERDGEVDPPRPPPAPDVGGQVLKLNWKLASPAVPVSTSRAPISKTIPK